MRATRYFQQKECDFRLTISVRDTLSKSKNWGIQKSIYTMIFDNEKCKVIGTDKANEMMELKGIPSNFIVKFITGSNREMIIDTTENDYISIEVASSKFGKSGEFKDIEVAQNILGLIPIASTQVVKTTNPSIFITHSFSPEGTHDATNISRFLELLGFSVSSGKKFSPKSISDKVMEGLKSYDIIVAIVTPGEDLTWLIQETSAAKALNKPLFLLICEESKFKEGLLGDMEYIPYGSGLISDTHIPILEGLIELGMMKK